MALDFSLNKAFRNLGVGELMPTGDDEAPYNVQQRIPLAVSILDHVDQRKRTVDGGVERVISSFHPGVLNDDLLLMTSQLGFAAFQVDLSTSDVEPMPPANLKESIDTIVILANYYRENHRVLTLILASFSEYVNKFQSVRESEWFVNGFTVVDVENLVASLETLSSLIEVNTSEFVLEEIMLLSQLSRHFMSNGKGEQLAILRTHFDKTITKVCLGSGSLTELTHYVDPLGSGMDSDVEGFLSAQKASAGDLAVNALRVALMDPQFDVNNLILMSKLHRLSQEELAYLYFFADSHKRLEIEQKLGGSLFVGISNAVADSENQIVTRMGIVGRSLKDQLAHFRLIFL